MNVAPQVRLIAATSCGEAITPCSPDIWANCASRTTWLSTLSHADLREPRLIHTGHHGYAKQQRQIIVRWPIHRVRRADCRAQHGAAAIAVQREHSHTRAACAADGAHGAAHRVGNIFEFQVEKDAPACRTYRLNDMGNTSSGTEFEAHLEASHPLAKLLHQR
jgi:hypothetical protein